MIKRDKYLKLGRYTRDCPASLIKKFAGFKSRLDRYQDIIALLMLLRTEFSSYYFKNTKTHDFRKSRFISARAILRKRQATCGSVATVAAAVLRRYGVPTKLIHGYFKKEDPDMRHAWLEVYIKAENKFVPIDVTRKDFKVGRYHVRRSAWVDWAEMEKTMKKPK